MTNKQAGNKKSAPLDPKEFKALHKYRNKFDTEVACAISLGVDRLVLNRILLVGSGSHVSIERVRKGLMGQ